jgi:hypothetical protein
MREISPRIRAATGRQDTVVMTWEVVAFVAVVGLLAYLFAPLILMIIIMIATAIICGIGWVFDQIARARR